ncbi:MAG: hypothetical protein CL693_16915 [Cellvibrionaceae bacterium]|nr:hypothetical protein [Cellvibrionaceae bacterium]
MALFSIGYATKSITTFIEQLQRYGINAVADVRSVPYSATFFDYHQDRLEGHLARAGIRYVYLGKELGPRSKDPEHYDDCGQVQFDRLMTSKLFNPGTKRLTAGLEKGFNIALMCAEKDPSCCHRSLLIAYALERQSLNTVQHITHNGDIESQAELEKRLSRLQNVEEVLFMGAEQKLEEAYKRHCQLKAYKKPAN